jgi:phosphoribosylformimino-5-aminoimidazole carboxamide ribotide isomerase
METIKALLRGGIERVILGTAAIEDPALVMEACRSFRESIVVSIDARDAKVATHGWTRGTGQSAMAVASAMVQVGVRRFIYTDINRDGTLTEPNFSAIGEMVDALKLPVLAAGGISSLNHLRMLNKLGVEGAIVGKAMYTGDINLKQALAEMGRFEA